MKNKTRKKIIGIEEEEKKVEEKSCNICGTSLIIQPRQTRCIDEGMTIFYICLKCPRTIKIS